MKTHDSPLMLAIARIGLSRFAVSSSWSVSSAAAFGDLAKCGLRIFRKCKDCASGFGSGDGAIKGWKIVRSSLAARSCLESYYGKERGNRSDRGGRTNNEVWTLRCCVAKVGDQDFREHFTDDAALGLVVG